MCKLLGYSKQAYYKWSNRAIQSEFELAQVRSMILRVRSELPRLGTRKIYYLIKQELEAKQIKVGRDKLFTILRQEDLLIVKRRKYTKTTHSQHWMRKYPNLIKDLKLVRAEQLWVADITYLQTKKGYEYLHLITDACSKRIMGYELADDLKASSTIKALKMALSKRKYNMPLIHHSDRGLQYCSYQYTEILKKEGIKISMTEEYDPYENAIAERVNGILKDEFGLDTVFESRMSLRKQLEESIKLYNNLRPHLSINMLTPIQAHNQHKITPKKWKTKKPSKLALKV